ncbi:tryptophan 2,3-dioxygenase (vermilion) [Bernardetia litoralis DSM 6794]|uniref:Tryptophan 2,3-dioxygenase (Vermilion) n=1 Tax=Bernardetia litoralis (strain ATCC 23117 / DSM 6794 / NBRC 15988 / NCIMB 1366 / Fx l1 / Sio-4) TaxID=880071 RepID=I4ANU9_BERLS|nr:tryptophan 2,3-dioxygenase family protein [Bernardetia litoralis]AFM05634.1 tryptophan 2,3-dioxygenase (vermilion) [Bernardetia litoralis DSM 6794]
MTQEEIIKAINEKYKNLGENPDSYLKGLLQAKPINYWDYIEVDSLLSLQKPRTDFKDEEIFIIYHQITELTLKLMVHELKQIVEKQIITEEFISTKIHRLNRYTSMLINSFSVMSDGMDYDDYNTFRSTLTPASGFQSAQFRFIELYCTRVKNLINQKGIERLKDIENPTIEDYFEHIYWKDAGQNRKTGKKTLTLRQFEEKYLDDFIALAKELEGNTIEDKLIKLDANSPISEQFQKLLRKFDILYNVTFPLVHLNTAKHYLDSKGENKAATGGSEWKKYLHPKFQQRKFFPTLWTEEEKEHWAEKE